MKNRRSLQWFIDRIGKRIYRAPIKCCAECKSCAQSFVDIWDGTKKGKQELRRDFHASYLYDCHIGLEIEYFDELIKE